MRRIRWQPLFVAFLFFAMAIEASACPNCKEAVAAQPAEAANMAAGYNWSIMLMLVVPFTMMTTGAFMVRRAVKLGTLPEM
jgi:hypothetical protein